MDAQENQLSASCMLKVTYIIVPRRTRIAVLPQHIRRRQDGGDDEEDGDNLSRVGALPSASYILLSFHVHCRNPTWSRVFRFSTNPSSRLNLKYSKSPFNADLSKTDLIIRSQINTNYYFPKAENFITCSL
jgi:hypothetical protein